MHPALVHLHHTPFCVMFSPLSSQPLPARQSPPSHELADIQSGADEEAQVLRYQDWDDEGEMADASRTLSGSSRRTGVVRGLQRLFGWTAWRKVPTHGAAPIEDEDSNDPLLAGVLSEPTRPSSSAKSTSSVELTMTGNERRPAHPARTEHALLRCFALAAAVTTWCLLQPFILFFLAAHFKKYVSLRPLCLSIRGGRR